jgi:hypothetical protein
MSEQGKETRRRFPRRAASSASTTSTSAAASSSPFSTAAPLAKRAKTVEELAAAAANKKHGNRPKRAFAELSQAAGLAAPTLQAVVDQATKKARMKNGQRTSARADGDDQQRTYFRRGEQEGVRASYAKEEKDFDAFKDLCEKLDTRKITTRQLQALYDEGKTGNNSPRTIKNYVYKCGNHPPGRYKTMTRWLSSDETARANRMLLSPEQEDVMQRVLIHAHRHKKPFVEADIKQWARVQLRKMKVGALVAKSNLDAWFQGFMRRCDQKGITITKGETQQQSSGRAGVSVETITNFVMEVARPELAAIKKENGSALTLNDTGNSDEWWFDINKILQTSAALGPATEERRSEVPGERSAHTTVLSAFRGVDSTPEQRAAKRAASSSSSSSSTLPLPPPPLVPVEPMPRTLKEYITAKSGDDSSYVVDEMEYHWLETLSLDTWNSEHFSILPVMVIFVGKSGADPEWTRLCRSDRMLCTTTHDGWMDDKSKLAWLNVCIEDGTNPYGERPQLSNFDGHWSNETIEYSARMEEAQVTGLETPGHHTAALQQMDQRGGPIQHANRVARALLRRYARAGPVGNAEIMRIIEMSVAASHTPAVCTFATTKVGWHEDDDGELSYDPIGTIDASVMKNMIKEEKDAAAAEASAGSSSSSNPYTDFIDRPGAGAALAAECCSELFWKRAALKNAEDPSEVDDEEVMSRRGRRCNPGAVITKQSWRDHKQAIVTGKKKKEQDKKTKQFEEYKRVCSTVDEYEKLTDKAVGDMTVPQLKVFIEVRTTEKVKGQPGKPALLQSATAKKDDEVRLRKPSVPEGYAAWKQQQAQAATAAAPAQAQAAATTPATTPAQAQTVDLGVMSTAQKTALMVQLQQQLGVGPG